MLCCIFITYCANRYNNITQFYILSNTSTKSNTYNCFCFSEGSNSNNPFSIYASTRNCYSKYSRTVEDTSVNFNSFCFPLHSQDYGDMYRTAYPQPRPTRILSDIRLKSPFLRTHLNTSFLKKYSLLICDMTLNTCYTAPFKFKEYNPPNNFLPSLHVLIHITDRHN